MSGLSQLVAERLSPLGVYRELKPFIPSLEPPKGNRVEVRALCPFHNDHDPSWCWNLAKAVATCHVCKLGDRSMIGYIAERTGRAGIAVLDEYCRRLGLPRPRQRTLTVADYALHKKLPEEFLRSEFSLGDSEDGITIPYLDRDGLALAERYRKRIGSKPKWRSGAKANQLIYGLHGANRLNRVPILYACEGESDLHTAWFHGLPAVALPGATLGYRRMAEFVCEVSAASVMFVAHMDAAGWLMTERLNRAMVLNGYNGDVRKLRLPVNDLSELHVESPQHFDGIIRSATERAVPVEQALAEREHLKEVEGAVFGHIVQQVLRLKDLNPTDRLMLIAAAEIVADDPHRPFATAQSKIAKSAGITRRTFQNRLPGLLEGGLLIRDRRGLRLGEKLVKKLRPV